MMIPRSSAISGRCPSSPSTAWKRRCPRAAVPASLERVGCAARDRPVGDEPAEVVDPGDVDELERAPEPLHPPAEALVAHRAPVVHGLAPELALGMGDVRRRAGDELLREELRMRGDLGALLGDVDRDVADQVDPALARVPPQLAPLAVEAHLVGERAGPA